MEVAERGRDVEIVLIVDGGLHRHTMQITRTWNAASQDLVDRESLRPVYEIVTRLEPYAPAEE